MEILTASLGFCIGIDRTYRKMNERAEAGSGFHVAHQHGGSEFDTLRRIERKEPQLLARYPALGKLSVVHDTSDLQDGDKLVLGFHGLPDATKKDLAARGVEILEDLICPFIAKLDRMVERHASEGFDIAIVGTKGNHHCEVAREIASQHGRRCFVVEGPEDIGAILEDDGRPMALVGQVTGNTVFFAEVMDRIRESRKPIKISKTMCADSYARQEMAVEFAREADVVLVADDGGAAAKSVAAVCSRFTSRLHWVRAGDEICAEWLEGASKVAIIGGIMTPNWVLEGITQRVRDLDRDAKHP